MAIKGYCTASPGNSHTWNDGDGFERTQHAERAQHR